MNTWEGSNVAMSSPHVILRCRLGAEAYHKIVERARQLGIDTPDQAVTNALSIWYCLTTKMLAGSQLLVRHDEQINELPFPHPTRAGELLVSHPDHLPSDVWWLGESQ